MSDRDTDFEALWAYCTANNRLVPMPQQWNELYLLLGNTRQEAAVGHPPAPLILAAWRHSTPLEKQLRFREHLEWARQHDQIEQVSAFLRALPENQWCHFGEV